MECGTTTAAARRMGLSQSAVSRSLSSLEARIGYTLFNRESGRLTPTHEAVRLNANLDDLFEALLQIDQPSGPVREALRIMAPPTYAHRLLAQHTATFLKANPAFFISLEIGTADDVIAAVLDRRIDLGITGVELSRAGLKLIPFRKSLAVCVMRHDHALARCDPVTPGDLHQQNLIALTGRHLRRAQLEKVAHEAGARLQIVAEAGTSIAAIELVRHGLGIAIVNPFPALSKPAPDLVVRRFESSLRYRTYFAVSDQVPVTRISSGFMRHVRTHAASDAFSERM